MSLIKPTRRGLILGLSALLVAPAIVRASSLMPVKAIKPEQFRWDGPRGEVAIWNSALGDDEIRALAAGFPPQLVHPLALALYAPMWRAA